MTDLVVEMRGGVVQEVYCDDSNIRVIIVDWDELQPAESSGNAGRRWSRCAPLHDLPRETRAHFQQAIGDKHA